MRRMPPDGLCLFHAVNYATNPEMYDKVDVAENGMLLGKGSGPLYEAAAQLRNNLIDTLLSEGHHEQARRLSMPGAEGYAEEEDFPTLSRIASLPFEIVIESAPAMEPRKYGDGDPRARFILRDILDNEGHRSSHWDVAELYDRKKRRRITGKKGETPAAASSSGEPPAISSAIVGMGNKDGISAAAICEPHSLPAAASSRQEAPTLSADILAMENKVGQYIRDNGNPQERDLRPMLQKMGHRYTHDQIRLWKRHCGAGPPDQTTVMNSDHRGVLASAAYAPQEQPTTPRPPPNKARPITTDATSSQAKTGVPDDILDMENTVGPLIRAKGIHGERRLYSMLKTEGHPYTQKQVRLWNFHYGAAENIPHERTTIDAETTVRDHHEDITFCMNLGEGRKRLMTRLSGKGFSLTEHQARLALLLVKYAELPAATCQQWEDFGDILA